MKRLIGKILWRLFPIFEYFGIHVLPIHYYSPIPDTREIRNHPALFNQEHAMYGVNMREEAQLDALNVLKDYEGEYKDGFPVEKGT